MTLTLGTSILKTTDGGINWQEITIPVETEIVPCEFGFSSVFFIDEQIGWLVGSGGIILKTLDGGENWKEQHNNNDWQKGLYDIVFVSETEGWAVGRDGIILHTNDGGSVWNTEESRTAMDLLDVTFLSEGAGWICGQWGTFLSTFNSIPSDVKPKQLYFKSSQNKINKVQPNPFSIHTSVQYSIKEPAFVKFSVFNLQGQVIKIIENSFQNAGDYSLTWDGTDNNNASVPNGVYFLNLESQASFSQRKVILLR